MRRRALVEPTSRLAVSSLWLTACGIAVAVVAVLATRADWLDGGQAVLALAIGLGLVGISLLMALTAGAMIWFTGYRGARYAVAATLISAALLAYPAALAVIGSRLPALNDIVTDPSDPPAFDIVASARPSGANPSAYPPAFAELQRRLYPEIRPVEIDLPAEDVNELVTDMIDDKKWRILDQVDFRGAQREGRFELVTRSLVMGFRDDIVIRIRQVGPRARIDIRSAARYGRQDFGVNARRVITAIDELRTAARRAQR